MSNNLHKTIPAPSRGIYNDQVKTKAPRVTYLYAVLLGLKYDYDSDYLDISIYIILNTKVAAHAHVTSNEVIKPHHFPFLDHYKCYQYCI